MTTNWVPDERFLLGLYIVGPHMIERELWSLPPTIRTLIPSEAGAPSGPHRNLVTSKRCHLQILSQWRVKFQDINLGDGVQRSVHKKTLAWFSKLKATS